MDGSDKKDFSKYFIKYSKFNSPKLDEILINKDNSNNTFNNLNNFNINSNNFNKLNINSNSLNGKGDASSNRLESKMDDMFDFNIFPRFNIFSRELLVNRFNEILFSDFKENTFDFNGVGDKERYGFLRIIKSKSINYLLSNNCFKHYILESSNGIFYLIGLILLFFVVTGLIGTILFSLEIGVAIFIILILLLILVFYFPNIQKQNISSSFSKELPYALRQLSTELKSGKSLFDSLDSIVNSDYGILSLEFSRVLEEVKYGENMENAFLNLNGRINSVALSRVIREILASLSVGSNLASSLNIISEDINFDMRMKLKEYSEKLNAFVMIYTFLAILAPVIILTMLLAASVVIGDVIPNDLVLILYSIFFPLIIVFLGVMVKKLEPKF